MFPVAVSEGSDLNASTILSACFLRQNPSCRRRFRSWFGVSSLWHFSQVLALNCGDPLSVCHLCLAFGCYPPEFGKWEGLGWESSKKKTSCAPLKTTIHFCFELMVGFHHSNGSEAALGWGSSQPKNMTKKAGGDDGILRRCPLVLVDGIFIHGEPTKICPIVWFKGTEVFPWKVAWREGEGHFGFVSQNFPWRVNDPFWWFLLVIDFGDLLR